MNVERILRDFGRTVFLSGADGWQSEKFSAFIQPLRYKTKLYLSGECTPVGINGNDAYLYIGSPRHDITRLEPCHRINDSDGGKYIIDKAEKIYLGEKPLYIWAVIRKTTEGKI